MAKQTKLGKPPNFKEKTIPLFMYAHTVKMEMDNYSMRIIQKTPPNLQRTALLIEKLISSLIEPVKTENHISNYWAHPFLETTLFRIYHAVICAHLW